MGEKRRRAKCHLHKRGGQGKMKRSEYRVVYMMKSTGTKTEPWGKRQKEV